MERFEFQLAMLQKGAEELEKKIASLHQNITDTRKDWQFKLANHLCDQAGMIFVEDIDFRVWAKGMFSKHTLDAGFGQFIFLRGFGGAIRPTPYLYPGRRWDTWTSPVKFTGLDVPKLNI